ncbi:diaminopimelate decarboxylase [candidate division KSB3 bacterium]|uniref:Diaminopimelate decarboxylase n=1 Tax=candidate division KSB3 bacterium TaxID=2044937 RepID=A0A2G6E2I2_9BACT|nr:MAG: diaminopimelate decarboxylase [candidate division KSB3 bacterium]PIE29299.1 MAG: diaminopimelate decarboxylase [candidate division KSB3 bacterium]
MAEKNLPFSYEHLQEIIKKHPTPFHIYDEHAIRENARRLLRAFAWNNGFKEYFAVKATPNPFLLSILAEEGFGTDCSSLPELILSEKSGIIGEEIMFSSNDTPAQEFVKAKALGAIINLDDISHIDFVEKYCVGLPNVLSFRYNPGKQRTGGSIIMGNPEDAKYGLTFEQIFEAYTLVRDRGVERFGLHSFINSNELNSQYFIDSAIMLFDLAIELYRRLGIRTEFVNLSGGIGIPYRPDQDAVDLEFVSEGIHRAYEEKITANGLAPMKIFMESGRMITGPYGCLISKVLHMKHIYKTYVGLDACMADLMRPALYGAYHHITVVNKQEHPLTNVYDVTGSLCENNDKFAIDRRLPEIEIGDILAIHDTGAHGHAMGFNYNGKLRSAELLLRENGEVLEIRRAETIDDYFATLDFNRIKQLRA